MGPAFARKYNTLLVAGTTAIQIPIIKRGTVDYAVGADWTPAAGDVKISKDGGAAANVTNLPTAIAMGNTAYWQFILTATELSAANVVVTIADSATKAVEDQCFLVETFGHASAMYQADLSAANLPANVVEINGGAASGVGTPEVNVTQWNSANVATPDTAGYPKITIKSGTGTGEISLTSGAVNTVGSVTTKTGYKLASDGLDSISTTAPAGVAGNFREMVVAVWRAAFRKSTLTATQLKTYADDGTTVLTTQTVSDDGTTQTKGAAS